MPSYSLIFLDELDIENFKLKYQHLKMTQQFKTITLYNMNFSEIEDIINNFNKDRISIISRIRNSIGEC